MKPDKKMRQKGMTELEQLMKLEKFVMRQGVKAEIRALKIANMEMWISDNPLRNEWFAGRLTKINNRLKDLNHE